MTNLHGISGFSPFLRVFTLLLLISRLPVQGGQADTVLLPLRNLRVSVHVFQNDSGLGNFSPDSVKQAGFLKELADWVNHRLANLDTLKPAMPSSYVADARVRIRLDTVFYHRDSRAWDCSAEIDSPYMRDRYVDADSTLDYRKKYQTLPVFIGDNNPVIGGHSRNIGDRGYIAVRGYYEAYLRLPFSEAIDECGRNLVHELGHCLGLTHNFQGGPGGDQCDNCEDNGCPVEGTSNNIMDYWPSYGYALSKCQFNLIQFYLEGGRGNISEVVINDSCYRVPGDGYQVSGQQTINKGDSVYLHQDMIIRSGGVVLVNGYLSMPGDAKIEVEPGGKLEINGGTIGNLCGDLWSGIRVNANPSAVPSYIFVTGNGTIEHARIGLMAAGPTETEFYQSVFRNCEESIVFLNGSSDSLFLNNCAFRITSKLNHYEEGIMPGIFVEAAGITNLDVRDCSFANEPGTSVFDADWMGTGISASGTSVNIENSGFTNLTAGLDIQSRSPDSKLNVTNCLFTGNRYGLKTSFAGIQWISDNVLILQRFNNGSTVGLYLQNPDRFAVTGNRFESEYGGGRMAGIVVKDPGTENSPVYGNRFSNLPVALFLDGAPAINPALYQWAAGLAGTEMLRLGPQFRFNLFDRIPMRLAMVSDSVFGAAEGPTGDLKPDYSVSATQWTPGGFAWYAPAIRMMAFKAWKQPEGALADNSLYWFMNYLGLGCTDSLDCIGTEPDLLRDYIRKLKALDDSGDPFLNTDVYSALQSIRETPAAVRSVRQSAYWLRYGAEDDPWLRESLASIAGRFSKADSSLTGEATSLAKKNLNSWQFYRPAVLDTANIPQVMEPVAAYDLPDLSAFLIARPPQQPAGKPAFLLYPNPAHDYIQVQPLAAYTYDTPWEGFIVAADGRNSVYIRIQSWEDQRINISRLPAGVYLVELFSGNQYLGASKFVKITTR